MSRSNTCCKFLRYSVGYPIFKHQKACVQRETQTIHYFGNKHEVTEYVYTQCYILILFEALVSDKVVSPTHWYGDACACVCVVLLVQFSHMQKDCVTTFPQPGSSMCVSTLKRTYNKYGINWRLELYRLSCAAFVAILTYDTNHDILIRIFFYGTFVKKYVFPEAI